MQVVLARRETRFIRWLRLIRHSHIISGDNHLKIFADLAKSA
jgi:hypothetical protein